MSAISIDSVRAPDRFRDYQAEARKCVKELYRLNHGNQTLAFVRSKHEEYLPLRKRRMSVWQAIDSLNALVDDSDPDLDLPQIDHALQTAEALRAADKPRWLVLAGFVHDLGKVLCSFGEPQWAVVGDTFPVGCRFHQRIVYSELFTANPDTRNPEYQTTIGVYAPSCGLDRVYMSWGHDEYLYHVVKDYVPEEAAYVVRYHSFYAWHREGAYTQLMNERDHKLLAWVKRFNPYDLYSKSVTRPDFAKLRPYYEDLVAEFLPTDLQW
jgi:inositol oxygenase